MSKKPKEYELIDSRNHALVVAIDLNGRAFLGGNGTVHPHDAVAILRDLANNIEEKNTSVVDSNLNLKPGDPL